MDLCLQAPTTFQSPVSILWIFVKLNKISMWDFLQDSAMFWRFCGQDAFKSFTLNWKWPKTDPIIICVGKEKLTLSINLIDFYDTTEEKLVAPDHVPGPKCRCAECIHLKDLEDRWILKMGTFYGDSGLNTRDEIKSKIRGHW